MFNCRAWYERREKFVQKKWFPAVLKTPLQKWKNNDFRLFDFPKQGNGSPRLGIYKPIPPFFGSWEKPTVGYGKKKAPKKTRKGKGIILGKNSPFKNVPLLNILL